jgi:hypothetical protein
MIVFEIMYKLTKIFIIGFIITNTIWFSFILIISRFEALPHVIFWGGFQILFCIWLASMFEFISPVKIDKDRNAIHVSGKHIPLSSIHYIEGVSFQGSLDCLALGYMSKKGKPIIKITGESKDLKIVDLCNMLRKMKGFPEQKGIKQYPGGSLLGYYNWKRNIKDQIQRKHDERNRLL